MNKNKVSTEYTSLSELTSFRGGYIIIDTTLFLIDRGTVEDSWELHKGSIKQMVAEARAVAELSNRRRIVVDDEGCYNSDVVSDEGELLTAYESYERLSEEEQDDNDSFAEYFFDR